MKLPALPPIPKPEEIKKKIIDSQIWRSMFRGGVWKDTPRDRAQHILGNVWLHLHPSRVRKHGLKWTYTWGLGGLSFFLFLILTVTGVLLMFYYRPSVELAYRDMKDLEYAVSMGGFIRAMHRWAAHSMVLIVILHMARVFMTGSYKTPREFNWAIGVVLLTLTLLLSFTGYLLPWDQLALWAVTVGTNMGAATPLLGAEGPFSILGRGNDVRFVLLGGKAVGAATLIRFYVLHCVALPLVAGALMIVHFWRIRKDTFSGPVIKPEQLPHDKVDTWPHLVVREYIAALGCMVVISAWSLWMKAPLEEMANPTVTPNPSKAPWYFTGLQELLVYFDPWIAGVVLPTMIIIGLIAFPYLDPDKNRGVGSYAFKERPFAQTYFGLGIGMWFILIFIGSFLRGPNWDIYWPWESWLIHKAPPPATWSLPVYIGGPLVLAYFGLGMILPRLGKADFDWKKSLKIGAVIIVGLACVLHLVLLKGHTLGAIKIPPFGWEQVGWFVFFGYVYYIFGILVPRRHLATVDQFRYAASMVLVLMTLGVLMKMGVRLGFHIKYILTIPAVSFNI
jgi:quinol-cytochrome oxidoreductase complex cytochrome b subunit